MGLPGMQNLSQKAMLDTAFFQFCKQIPGVNVSEVCKSFPIIAFKIQTPIKL